MYTGHYIFAQLMDHVPWHIFRQCVARYDGEHKIRHFSCRDQFRCYAFAQLTWRESLRDIEACLNIQSSKLYHLGFRCPRIARNTMANANAVRDWRIYADFAQHLIGLARKLYANDTPPDLEGLDTVYRRLTCVCRFFRGLRFVRPKRQSNRRYRPARQHHANRLRHPRPSGSNDSTAPRRDALNHHQGRRQFQHFHIQRQLLRNLVANDR